MTSAPFVRFRRVWRVAYAGLFGAVCVSLLVGCSGVRKLPECEGEYAPINAPHAPADDARQRG